MAEVICHPYEKVMYCPQQQKEIHPWYTLLARKSTDKKAAGRDDVLVEELKNMGPKDNSWLLAMLNKYFMENKILTI